MSDDTKIAQQESQETPITFLYARTSEVLITDAASVSERDTKHPASDDSDTV